MVVIAVAVSAETWLLPLELVIVSIVEALIAAKSATIVIVSSAIHHTAWPRVGVVGIAATNVNILIVGIDASLEKTAKVLSAKEMCQKAEKSTYNSCHSEHFKLRSEIQRLGCNESLQIACLSGNAQHGGWAHDKRLFVGLRLRSVVLEGIA